MTLLNYFIILLITLSCASKSPSYNQRKIGHRGLYSLSQIDQYDDDDDEYKLDLIFIKNLSNIKEKEISFIDRKETLKVSGKKMLRSYLKIARNQFKKDFLLLNGGNHLNSTIMMNKDNINFLNQIKPHANALTFNDFKGMPLSYIDLKVRHTKSPTILSNFIDLSQMKNFQFKKSESFKIIKHKGTKIGIINIISPKLLPKKSVKNLKGLIIEDVYESFLKYSIRAKNNGAQIVIAFLNLNSDCAKKTLQ